MPLTFCYNMYIMKKQEENMKNQEENMTVNESVEKMIATIKANGGSSANNEYDSGANYMLGYLGSMLVSLATKYPEVLKEVNATTDWVEGH
jgi:hypothetical protein